MDKVIITEYEFKGEIHRFYTLGDTHNYDNSVACYNEIAVGEDGEETYRDIRTWMEDIADYKPEFIKELQESDYIIR